VNGFGFGKLCNLDGNTLRASLIELFYQHLKEKKVEMNLQWLFALSKTVV